MPYGVTTDGFVDKPIETILAEIEAAQKVAFGDTFDVSAQSPAGQLNGVFATQLREVWEVAQGLYSAIDPDAATGDSLAALASLTGTVRAPATPSTVTATVNLDAGKTLVAGAVASVSGSPTSRFVTLADATNSGGSPANVSVEMESETAGPVVANAGTLTVIVSAQSGWNSVTNALDATIGTDDELDEDLRIRREEDLRRAGAASVDAIESDVRAVADVTSCTVFNNPSDYTDGDGIPPHAFEALVLGGAVNDIAQAIWDSMPAGIEAHGDTSGTAVDSDGENRTVDFTRPDEVPLYLDIFVTVDADTYPVDGDTQIKTAIAAWSQDALQVGDDLILSSMYATIFGVAGVLDVTQIQAGTAPAPSGTSNITLTARQIGTIDTTDITVTST
jgi:uncharacterized phage protein gp47/JayE